MATEVRYEHPVVVLELTPTGLSVARSLGSRGIPVHGIDPNHHAIGHFSKYVRKSPRLKYRMFDERLANDLVDFARRQRAKPVLYCCGDPSLEFGSAFRELLAPYFLMPESLRPEISGVFVNKISFYQKCQSLNIKLPATYFPTDLDELRTIAGQLHYPAIIKPAYSHLWRKVLKGDKVLQVESTDELIRVYENYCTDADRRKITVQEVIIGPEANIAVFTGYFNRDHELICGFTARKLRQYPPFFGSASYVESAWLPEVAELSRQALRAMGYHGIAGTEYKYDTRRKEWLLIEINPRVVLWQAIARAAGADVIFASYLDLIGQRPSINLGGQQNGIRWQFLLRDTITVLRYAQHRWAPMKELLNYFDPRKEFAIIDMNDPALLLMYPLYAASQAIGFGGMFF